MYIIPLLLCTHHIPVPFPLSLFRPVYVNRLFNIYVPYPLLSRFCTLCVLCVLCVMHAHMLCIHVYCNFVLCHVCMDACVQHAHAPYMHVFVYVFGASMCVLFCRAIPVDLLAVPDSNSSIHCWLTDWHFTHTQVVYVHTIILRSSNWSTCIWLSTHPFHKAFDNILTLSLLHVHVHVHVRHVCNNFYMHAHVPME